MEKWLKNLFDALQGGVPISDLGEGQARMMAACLEVRTALWDNPEEIEEEGGLDLYLLSTMADFLHGSLEVCLESVEGGW